ncbi:MAG: ABC transporter ATP-binding protein [Chromatiaceae bacterium]|nr:MAG: ABC transporter ATP-binding protein [Chromatiaceae bacterium]
MVSIELSNVSVAFPVFSATHRSLKMSLLGGRTGGTVGTDATGAGGTVVRALDQVSLRLQHGDRLGLVGHNGAGKTTLLRVLARIYEPAVGSVQIQGDVAPLFDVNLGMDMDATGYDNILFRGLFLGLTKRQVEARMQEIAEFTELGQFLDMPIRTYSNGMRLRLAFAVSTSIDPEILLLDEGIGAGDAAFLVKAKTRLRAFAERAGIIVLASHSSYLIREMCDQAALMEQGRILAVGGVEEILEQYQARVDGQLVGA